MNKRDVLKILAGVLMSAALIVVASSPAAAAPQPWSATHGTASVSGTYTVTTESGPVLPVRRLTLNGELTSTSAECYTLEWFIIYDFFPRSFDITAICGSGTVPVSASAIASTPTTTINVRICRTDSDCGAATRLL